MTNAPGFNFSGSLEFGLFALWIVLLIVGIIWRRQAAPKSPARLAFRNRTALGLIILGVLGLVNSIAQIVDIDVVAWPLWGLIVLLVALGFIIYSWWFARSTLPGLVDASKRNPNAAPKHYTAPGTVPTATSTQPRPEATTGRRDARRAKKRKR